MRRSAAAVMALMALAGTGCGSGSDGDGLATLENTPSTSAPSGADVELAAEEAVLALTECLRENGVDLPDPEFDDQGNLRLRSLMDLGESADRIDPADLEAGFEACSHHLDGVAQIVAGIDRTAIEDRLYDFAACMREQGYDMPDPDFGAMSPGMGPGGGEAASMGPFGEIDAEDPAFLAASEACMWVFGETIGPGGFGPATETGGG
ncbi:MAG: hypothetical protein KJ698_06560 [Actinobacteria bacterium]|nr:hypothetical protein [Actinomycetota bacterium]MBU1494264.1 hypothetical protein [Actinomycetota bacterium]